MSSVEVALTLEGGWGVEVSHMGRMKGEAGSCVGEGAPLIDTKGRGENR